MKKKRQTPRSVKIFKVESAAEGIKSILLNEMRYVNSIKEKIVELANNLEFVTNSINKELEHIQFDVINGLKELRK